MEFTKEQLIERINEALPCFRHCITPDNELQVLKKTIAIYEIALAALTAPDSMHKPHKEIPRHRTDSVKLMAIVHRLQQIMINENLTPAELVGCAEIVRDSYGKCLDISNPKIEVFAPARGPIIPPPRRR